MVHAIVIGASGYTGAEAVRLLLGHPSFELLAASSDAYAGKELADLYPALLGLDSIVLTTHAEALACKEAEIAFLAIPHTASLAIAPGLLKRGCAVVDLSADFRLKDATEYEQWYQTPHTAADLLDHAVYGLCEFNRAALQEKAFLWRSGKPSDILPPVQPGGPSDVLPPVQPGGPSDVLPSVQPGGPSAILPPLVANPGCYPTASALAIVPALTSGLVDTSTPIIINAISGVSGAGRKATATTHFCSASDDLAAYGVTFHRHTPEIAQMLSEQAGSKVTVVFSPHLAPLKRGMVATVVAQLKDGVDAQKITQAYSETYSQEPFVSFLPYGTMPHSASVQGTNKAQVGVAYNENAHCLVASCAIDNLGKGASAQAVQNANIIFGFAETDGLDAVGTVV